MKVFPEPSASRRPKGWNALSLLLGFGVVLAGCTSQPRVKTAFDRRVDFSRYRSFAMAHPNHPVPTTGGVDPFTLFRLRQMAYAQLAKQGYTPVTYQKAELLVSVNAVARSRTEVIPSSYWTPYHRDYYYGADVRTFEVMRLTIDISDARSQAVIWHGSTVTSAEDDPSDADLWPLVQSILVEFPPRALPPPK